MYKSVLTLKRSFKFIESTFWFNFSKSKLENMGQTPPNKFRIMKKEKEGISHPEGILPRPTPIEELLLEGWKQHVGAEDLLDPEGSGWGVRKTTKKRRKGCRRK